MTLTDAERQRYGEIATDTRNDFWATHPCTPLAGSLADCYADADRAVATAVVAARDADRTAELVGIVRGWRDEALAAAHALSPDMDSSFGRFQHFMIKIAAYDRMLALLEGTTDGPA